MSDIIQYIFGVIVITCTNIYIWSKLLRKKIDFKNKKIYIIFLLMSITTLLNYFYNNEFIKILTITIIMAFFLKILFDEKVNKSILGSVTSQLIYMVSEITFIATISLIFNLNASDIINTQFGTFTSNVIIAGISSIIVNFPFVISFYNFLIKTTYKVKNIQIIIFTFIVILIANILTMVLYYKVEFSYLLLFNMFITLFCFALVLYSFKTKNNYIRVHDKYNTTLKSLKEYENILERYRISNHENKNVLLTIRNMVPKTNKKIMNYIDTIVDNKLQDDDKIMLETAKIPNGGLRGLIYSKILEMKDLNINYNLEISKEIKTVNLIKYIDDSTMLDICKIIGVYLDNSIQAISKLKLKYVNIEMYLNDKVLIISISNNYKDKIEIDKIEDNGYTTKGKGHGYGLTLAKEIINNNKKLSNQKKINKDVFTQTLKIKM